MVVEYVFVCNYINVLSFCISMCFFFPQPMRETSKVAVAILYFVHVRILCNMKYPRRMHLDCSVAQQEILGQTARDSADVATQRRTK